MGSAVVKSFYSLVVAALFAGYSQASPRSSRLLSLVPAGAEVVSGFESQPAAGKSGRLVLSTHNNRVDFADWQALTGMDSQRRFEEVIEAAASDAGGQLSEHLLLVGGRFDRELIFRSLEQKGAQATQCQGQRILLIKPLARESGDMIDTRWLAILENRIGILGTQAIVQNALRRFADHSLPDPTLEERLNLLRPDVTSWNVLSRSRRSESAFVFAQPHSAWAELQQDTDLLIIGARFGSKTRIDFSIHAQAERGREFFTQKAAFFTDAMVGGPDRQPVSAEDSKRRVEKFSVGPNHIQGSVELTSRQYDAWCQQFSLMLASATDPARGN